MGNCNQRSNHTMPKIHLLMNEFLRRVVCIWGSKILGDVPARNNMFYSVIEFWMYRYTSTQCGTGKQ